MKIVKILMQLLLIVPTIGIADPDYSAALNLVQGTTEKLVKAIKEKKPEIVKDMGVAYDIAQQLVLPHFDIERMSKYVLAKEWGSASDEQKQKFMNEFKQLITNTYTRSIVEFSDETIDYLPVKPGNKVERVTIQTQVKPSTGKVIPIDYTLSIKDGSWKVIDVRIEEVSLVINYRSTFTRDIRKDGLDQFLLKLAEKNKQKQGG